MYISDLNDPELTGRSPAGEYIQQALMSSPSADSCLPPPPEVIRRKEGTALLELESIIREQLETRSHGVCPLNDKKNKIGKTPQGPHEIDLLAVSRWHKAR
jgi:hypothetical protein